MSHVQRVRTLYKIILKLHRGLPEELQIIGTNYARDEFRRHKSCKQEEAAVFLNEWTNYALSLAKQMGLKEGKKEAEIGDDLAPEMLDSLREEQVVQLYELMQESHAPKEVRKEEERFK